MGHITQEDPIGLAGGLNLYGYADGDPINFSDPFGLCAIKGAAASVAMGRGIAAATGSEYGVASLALDVAGGALCVGVLARGAQMLRLGGRAASVASRSGQVFSSYRDAQRVTRGAGGAIEAHHLVEARHLRNWGLNAADGPAVILTRSEHQAVTSELRRLLPYGQQHSREAVHEAY